MKQATNDAALVRRWFISSLFGERGERCLDRTSDLLCERRNPVLQLLYVLIVGGSYYVYVNSVFSLLPTAHAPFWHTCEFAGPALSPRDANISTP